MYMARDFTDASAGQYWVDRALETEVQMSRTHNPRLCAIYVELIEHYRRMASLRSTLSRIPKKRYANS